MPSSSFDKLISWQDDQLKESQAPSSSTKLSKKEDKNEG